MIKDGWYCCPHCGQKLFRVTADAQIHGIAIKCKGRECGKIINVKIGE